MSFSEDDPYDDRDRQPRRRYHPSDDDDDRRWGNDRDDYDDGPSQADPADKIKTPGTILLTMGILGVMATLGVLLALGGVAWNDPPPQEELIIDIILAVVLGAISLAYFGVMAIGAARMRQCRSYGWSMTSAVMAISSIVLFGACSVFIAPFGIWAVVVLSQPDVKRAFERRRFSYE